MSREVFDAKYYSFLDGLRESGAVNMFGAVPVLQQAFPELVKSKAVRIVTTWMENFNKKR